MAAPSGSLSRAAADETALPSLNQGDSGMSFGGFVAFIASIMAMNALGIDSMLPALSAIGRTLGIASDQQRQWIIVSYMIGFGAAQIVWGPLADRYGRKPILNVSMALYAVLSLVAGVSSSFPMLLIARLLQGIAASAGRVLVVSMVRDCYSGRLMARVMSLSFIVFLLVPILAPSIGQVVTLIFGTWRAIFFCFGLYAAIVAFVGVTRLKETLHPEYRRPLSFASVSGAMRRVLSNRISLGYMITAAFCFGAISGFITSVEPIFATVFHRLPLFPLIFACIAGTMGISAFLNSRFVERFGTRRISHGALIGFILISSLHALVAWSGHDTMVVFAGFQAATMFFFGLIGSNFNSMAMEPVGDIAGSAASVQGCFSTCVGAILGSMIGHAFNGTTIPLTLGFAILGAAAFVTVLITERGKLFRGHHLPPVRAR